MTIKLQSFTELTTLELYKIIQLRIEVFVMEQNCHYMDTDDKDLKGHHLTIWDGETLVAYCRILPNGVSYEGYASIGRVVSKPSHRKQSIGKLLMIKAIEACKKLYPDLKVKISAQCYLLKFYSDFGFEIVSEEYLEDNIPHKAMILKHK